MKTKFYGLSVKREYHYEKQVHYPAMIGFSFGEFYKKIGEYVIRYQDSPTKQEYVLFHIGESFPVKLKRDDEVFLGNEIGFVRINSEKTIYDSDGSLIYKTDYIAQIDDNEDELNEVIDQVNERIEADNIKSKEKIDQINQKQQEPKQEIISNHKSNIWDRLFKRKSQ